MQTILASDIFILSIVLGVYLLANWLYKTTKIALLHPLLTSIITIIALLKVLGIDYPTFKQGSHFIDFLLGPSVVALGFLLHEQIEHIKGRTVSILISILVGSLAGILSVIGIALLFGADKVLIATLQPKSVTTPIAIAIAERTGGVPAITAVVVIAVGIFGGIVGPFILDKLGVKSRIARGLALGASAHGIGTARAMELGAVEGAISGLAIGIMGLATAFLVPIVMALLSV